MGTLIDTLTGKRASVTLSVETAPNGAVARYVIEGSSGYRAVLPACGCNRPPCALPYGHSSGVQGALTEYGRCNGWGTFCHNWHEVSARRLAAQVLRTYGAKYRVTALKRARYGYLYVPEVALDQWIHEHWYTRVPELDAVARAELDVQLAVARAERDQVPA